MRHLAPLIIILAMMTCRANPVRVLVIGDSMSEEYANELIFSAPDSNPTNPNTVNWIESLDSLRHTDLDFGSDRAYPDLRGLGFEYNWGFPGATTDFWVDVFESSAFENLFYWNTTNNILNTLDDVDVVVLFLGGNDVSSIYGSLYRNDPDPVDLEAYLENIQFLVDALRDERPDVPIVLVNAPDIGATPDIQEDHPDPAGRADATAHIAKLNTRLTGQFNDNPQLVIADLFALTALILEPTPFTIGPVTMVKSYNRENRPNFLFCKEKFHPASGASALIANTIIEGINAVLGTSVSPLTETEIASRVLNLQPYLDWIDTFPGADPALLADQDGDRLPNIGEFALQTDPLRADAPSITADTPATLTFAPHPVAATIVEVVPEESTTLQSWAPVPPIRLSSNPDHSLTVRLPGAPKAFARLTFPLAP